MMTSPTDKKKNIETIYPLSPMQQGMLFHSLLAPKAGLYMPQICLTLTGTIDPLALQNAWQAELEQNQPLRTAFYWEQRDTPFQIVFHQVALPWKTYDWSNLEHDHLETQLADFLEIDRSTPFDLKSPPLLRLSLIQYKDQGYWLILTQHHLILDGWSVALLLQRVLSRSLNPQIQLEPPPSYNRYITWLNQQNSEEAQQFWQTYLSDRPAPTQLQIGHSRQSPSSKMQLQSMAKSLSLEQTDQLKTCAKSQLVTLNTLVQSAFALTQGRFSQQSEVIFGVTSSGRPSQIPEIDRMIGLFINTLPCRVKIDHSMSIGLWLQQIQTNQTLTLQYEYTALSDIQRWVDSKASLFESLLVFENYPIEVGDLSAQSALKIDQVRSIEWTHLPLTLLVSEQPDGLNFELKYNGEKFSSDDMEQYLDYLVFYLTELPNHKDATVQDIPALTPTDKDRITLWNQTAASYPEACIHSQFMAQAQATPETIALRFRGESLTYRELDNRSNQLAHYIQQQGDCTKTPVGVCLRRSFDLVIALLAISKAGGIYVPLDPDYPQERLHQVISQTNPRFVLVSDQTKDRINADSTRLIEFQDSYLQQPEDFCAQTLSIDSPFYILHTSGSTGTPKGILISHRSISNRLHWMQQHYPLTTSDRILQKTPYSFDVSVWEFFWPLLNGATLVMAEPGGHRDVTYLAQTITAEAITILHFVPSMLRAFLELAKVPSSIRLLFASGEALSQDLVDQWAKKSAAQIHNLYGPTEAAIDVTFYPCKAESQALVPIGTPIANSQIYILDADRQAVPIGVAGELYIGGVGLALGYWQQPELTADYFIETVWGRLYRTGDRAYQQTNGCINYLSRMDRQVKLNGFRIELGEIEAHLQRHPQVQQAVASIQADPAYLIAYVVGGFAEEAELSRELTAFLGDRLPSFMVPSRWILLTEFPVTANGKLDLKALPLPGQRLSTARPAVSTTEKMIAEIWCTVLKLGQVNATDNLFDLGGNSLVATRINTRLQEAFQLEIPLQSIFNHPTITQLATHIEQIQTSITVQTPNPSIPQADRTQPMPLSFAQRRLWFLEQLQPGTGAYNVPVAVQISGSLDFAALSQALFQLIQRHEVLRSQIVNVNGEPNLVLRSPLTPFDFPTVDLQSMDADQQGQEIRQLIRQQAAQPFNLESSWLIRGLLIRASAQEQIILLTLHHIVTDGWSMEILVQELAKVYGRLVLDRPVNLPYLSHQYADFALWQQNYLQGELLNRQIQYWQQVLAEPRAVLQLPADFPRSRLQQFEGAVHPFELSAQVSEQLRQLARTENTTLFVLLLSVYKVLLAKYSGQADVIVGCPIANRQQRDFEGVIGLFVNTLVLRSHVDANQTFQVFLAQVRSDTYAAYDHQDLPFERLVEVLQPERDLSYNPLFQVKFRLENAPTESIDLPGLSLRKLPQVGFSNKLDLSLDMYETVDGRIVGGFEYNQALFQPETIKRLSQHFIRLLESIVDQPKQLIAQLSLLSQPEKQCLIEEWNQTSIDYPKSKLFIQQFEAQVDQYPEAIALIYQAEGGPSQRLTYAELNQRCNQLARHLQDLGVGPESLVGICLERSLEMIIAMLATFKAGGAYVPLDPTYPEERLQFMLSDAKVAVLLTQSKLRSSLPITDETVVEVDRFEGDTYDASNFACPAAIDNLAYLIYTSGSTGVPKGVLVEHSGLLNLTLDKIRVCQVEPGDRVLQFFSFSFDASIPEIVMSLGGGATLCLADSGQLLPGPGLLNLLESLEITHITITPSALAQVCDRNLPALKMVLVGGEAPSPELIEQWGQGRLFINAYGPTETTVNASMVACGNGQPLLPTIRPSANKQLYILDAALQPLPIGVVGELYIGGIGLARGYHNRPEITAQRFLPNPWRSGERIYQTGDLAYHLPDGRIRLMGRVDDQVKIRGFRIELAEIETVLHQHPSVEAAIVTVREGETASQIFAYALSAQADEDQILGRELKAFLRQSLPEYMVPAAVMVLAEFPLTPNGKIDLKALPTAQYRSLGASPSNSVETRLLEIFQRVLQIEAIGVDDDFFELGGHSLLATQIVAQVLEKFGVELTVMDLFNAPTIATLAAQILRYQIQPAPGLEDAGEREDFEL